MTKRTARSTKTQSRKPTKDAKQTTSEETHTKAKRQPRRSRKAHKPTATAAPARLRRSAKTQPSLHLNRDPKAANPEPKADDHQKNKRSLLFKASENWAKGQIAAALVSSKEDDDLRCELFSAAWDALHGKVTQNVTKRFSEAVRTEVGGEFSVTMLGTKDEDKTLVIHGNGLSLDNAVKVWIGTGKFSIENFEKKNSHLSGEAHQRRCKNREATDVNGIAKAYAFLNQSRGFLTEAAGDDGLALSALGLSIAELSEKDHTEKAAA